MSTDTYATFLQEIANVLDRAHDEMLVRGHTHHVLMDEEGSVCLQGAVACAVGVTLQPGQREDNYDRYNQSLTASDAYYIMRCQGFSFVWNDAPERTVDEVLDAFRVVAKGLRNGEIRP